MVAMREKLDIFSKKLAAIENRVDLLPEVVSVVSVSNCTSARVEGF